jgi:murein L,D-transpeptidase YafK
MRRLFRLLAYLALIAVLGLVTASLFIPPERVTLPPPPLTGQIDRIVVEKAARRMQLIQDGKAVRTYTVALGFAPTGDKLRQGDGRTPEGEFTINRRNDQSAFHLSIGIDYPQEDDLVRARAGGYSPGGDIFIHGQPNAIGDGFRLRGDWTNGCIAVTNREMREIWAVTPIGTTVEIRP